MADDTLQWEWMVAIKQGLEDLFEEALFADQPGDDLLDFSGFHLVEAGD